MFEKLEMINERPKPFEFYTASDLWTDKHTSEQMLSFHLNEQVDLSSRNGAFITISVEWITSHFKVGPGKKIADFGCGPGLYTTRLAQKQADVTGIDFSKNSVRYAQKIADDQGLPIYNWLQYFSPEALKTEFETCGFTSNTLYSDVAGAPFYSETEEFAIVARKI
ncbi:MAG: hypothetical protein B6245_08325 [Desulfobacteraceae bacterium 4572_88]|nr:MAG: hypothetical protein B6245_08325 [Desulfobacteraceae bacterium 4572_88]